MQKPERKGDGNILRLRTLLYPRPLSSPAAGSPRTNAVPAWYVTAYCTQGRGSVLSHAIQCV